MSTIVYIDDEDAVCRAIALSLEHIDCQLLTFTEPAEAVRYINGNPPALVICDYRMPGLDGLEVLAKLDVDVPFVLISGYLDLEAPDNPRVMKVVAKPVSAEDLVALVESYASGS